RPPGPIPRRPGLPINPPSGGSGGQDGALIPGYTGIDGEWTSQYEAARTGEQRLVLVHSLRNNASGDLGPSDATTFVKAVYSGGPGPVRSAAQAALVAAVAPGGPVRLARRDPFAPAPARHHVSGSIGRSTGSILPGVRSDAWRMETRRALAQHTLRLYDPSRSRLDRGAAALALVYRLHAMHVGGGSAPADEPTQPALELQRLLDAW